MAAYGTTQNFDKPLAGDTRAVGATKLDLILDSLETTLSAKVTPSGMDINADLSLRSGSTYSALTDAKKLAMKPQASALNEVTHPAALWVNSDGELCYNDNDGNAVTMTSGGFVAAAAGNIGTNGSPAYAADGVELLWDAADGYHFYGDGGVAADVFVEAVRLVDGAYTIGILAPTLGTDYDITLPATLPGSTSVMTMSATGVIANTRALSVDSLAVSTISASGLISAAAGLTAAVDTHVTVSGTGKFKHGAKYKTINLNRMSDVDFSYTTGNQSVASSASAAASFDLPLEEGQHVSSISMYWNPAGTGSKIMRVYSIDESGTITEIASRTFTSSSTSDYAITGADFTVEAQKAYYLYVEAGDSGDVLYFARVVYDQP